MLHLSRTSDIDRVATRVRDAKEARLVVGYTPYILCPAAGYFTDTILDATINRLAIRAERVAFYNMWYSAASNWRGVD